MTSTPSPVNAPGFYGKIPILGDFVYRRLPREFITPWDRWLSSLLTAARERMGASWTPMFLRAPHWRFIAFPGCCGQSLWTGVMAPSADKNDRQYPFTIASNLSHLPIRQRQAEMLCDWLDAMDKIAHTAVHRHYTIDQLDAAIGSRHLSIMLEQDRTRQDAIEQIAATLTRRGQTAGSIPLADEDDASSILSSLLDSGAAVPLLESARNKSIWWTTQRGALQVVCCDGLPKPDQFVSMMLSFNRAN